MSKLKAQAAVVAKRIADYKASDSCAKRRGTRPRLAAQERLTQSARRLAGTRAEALAEYPPVRVERVREHKHWFA